MAAPMPTGKSAQSGFTYLFVLMSIGLIGMGLAAAGTLWKTEAQRERETELLFIGDQYRQAIRSFYERPGQQPPRLPQSVDELLEDRRGVTLERHLRRAWRDPFTGKSFALIESADSKGITGVHSESPRRPFKMAGFSEQDAAFADAKTIADWHFVFVPAAAIVPSQPAPAPAP